MFEKQNYFPIQDIVYTINIRNALYKIIWLGLEILTIIGWFFLYNFTYLNK